MCGQVGLAGNLVQKHKTAMRELLFLDTLRGMDSTGVASISVRNDISLFKQAVPGYDFISHPKVDATLKMNDIIWMGHNRFGTVGAKTRLNAHPFVSENGFVVGTHNGTIHDRYQLLDRPGDFGTDSEALINMIAERGVKEAIGEVRGAWALVLYDTRDRKLRFIRNKERPMFFGYFKNREGIIWASEDWMIETVCKRNQIELEKILWFKEDVEYRFSVPDALNKKWEEYEYEEGVAGKAPGFFQQGQQQTQTHQTQQETSSHGKTMIGGGTTGTNVVIHNDFRSGNHNFIRGFQGRLVGKQEAIEIGKGGCAWCEDTIINPVASHEGYGWLSPTEMICEYCLKDTHPKPYDDDGMGEIIQIMKTY